MIGFVGGQWSNQSYYKPEAVNGTQPQNSSIQAPGENTIDLPVTPKAPGGETGKTSYENSQHKQRKDTLVISTAGKTAQAENAKNNSVDELAKLLKATGKSKTSELVQVLKGAKDSGTVDELPKILGGKKDKEIADELPEILGGKKDKEIADELPEILGGKKDKEIADELPEILGGKKDKETIAEKPEGLGSKKDKETDKKVGESEKASKADKQANCETCKERKYQDGSNDPGVSFKTPTKLGRQQAASAVRSHEQEHVVREQAKAQREDRKVVSQSVTYHTGICPECGGIYMSGGTTRTVTKANNKREVNDIFKRLNSQMERKGFYIDARA